MGPPASPSRGKSTQRRVVSTRNEARTDPVCTPVVTQKNSSHEYIVKIDIDVLHVYFKSDFNRLAWIHNQTNHHVFPNEFNSVISAYFSSSVEKNAKQNHFHCQRPYFRYRNPILACFPFVFLFTVAKQNELARFLYYTTTLYQRAKNNFEE